jgi:hypothetical protein
MRVFCRGVAQVRHATTGTVYTISSDELDWNASGEPGGDMGDQLLYRADVEHDHLGTLTWELWEYPVGFQNSRDQNVGPHALLRNFDFGLEHEPDSE